MRCQMTMFKIAITGTSRWSRCDGSCHRGVRRMPKPSGLKAGAVNWKCRDNRSWGSGEDVFLPDSTSSATDSAVAFGRNRDP
jgi:hypothetical protein